MCVYQLTYSVKTINMSYSLCIYTFSCTLSLRRGFRLWIKTLLSPIENPVVYRVNLS